ncbi:MAG: pyridoxamine 5'-phosphate oxidase family protein [Casimicrobiaceae bacterium]
MERSTQTYASTHEANDVEARQTLRDRVRKIKFCMFTTADADGTLRSRPLTTQEIEPDGTIWFFVPTGGDVAAAIAANPNVNLAYADTGDNIFATLCGLAYVVHDREQAEALWSPIAAAWFPQGPADPNLALVRVDVDEAEYWKPEGTKIGQFVSIARAALTRTPPKEGEHRAVHF